jgi:hypothetical protein
MRLTSFANTAAFAALLATGLAPHFASAAPLDTNLIVNGDAEAGAGSNSGAVVPVPGWATTSNFTAVTWSAGGGFPTATDPGPADRGLNFFAGGPGTALSSATQLIDLSANSATIDAGQLQYELSGWLGGFSSQGDNAVLTATFLDLNGGTLSFATLGPVTATDRINQSGLLLRDTEGFVPAGTFSVEVRLELTRLDGSYNDGYADNLSFSVSAVPEPGTWAMLGSGLVLLGFGARARNRQG